MAYIGNPVDTAFTSLLKQDLTGASGTSLTLSHAVANANDIALYINNVRQEPTEAYSVNGTTVTLTGTVAGTDDIYVIYLARAMQTTVPGDGSVSTAKIANSAVDLTSKVTGVLPVANGGTGVNNFESPIEKIASNTTGATTTALEIDLSTSTDYRFQKLMITGLYTAAGDNVRMVMRNDADDTYVGSGYYTSNIMAATSGSSGNSGGKVDGGWNQAYFEMNYYGYGDHAVNEDNNLEINFYDTTDTTYRAKYMYHRVGSGSDAVHVTETGTGRLLSEVKVDRIKLYAGGGGNLIYRGYTLYGYRR